MPPRTNPLQRLAPDQRAAVELVLRQGRSYGELASLLGLPEETIRACARGGLEALAPDLPPPPRAGEVADWLLGQQAEAHAARTRDLVTGDPATRRWAETVAEPLRELGGDAIPAVPSAPELPPRRVNGTGARPRPLRDGATASAASAPSAAAEAAPTGSAAPDTPAPAPTAAVGAPADASLVGDSPAAASPPAAGSSAAPAAPRGRSSRLGGAILIAALVLIAAGVIAFVLTRGGDDEGNQTANVPAPATATATPTPAAGANDIVLRGPAGSQAVGLMRLFRANDDTVRFALAAQGVAPNKTGQRYSLWFRKKDGAARLLGDVKDPVKKAGTLTAAGPGNNDVQEFPTWFATYDTVLVTLDAPKARKPGRVVLSGNLPHAASSG